MKKLITIVVMGAVIITSGSLSAQRRRLADARYDQITEFLEPNATLNSWFKQYMKTTAGRLEFKDFLRKLGSSEILMQRSKRAGLTHNQLYSPLVTLIEKDWNVLDEMDERELATIKLDLRQLDIALAAIEATLPDTARPEFQIEVFRGAKPLTEVAKLPSATEAMTSIMMEHKLSDRINMPPAKIPPPQMIEPEPAKPYFPDSYPGF